MSKKDIGSQAKEGLFWTLFFHGIQFFLRMGSSIILARILFPEDFGLMALASIAIQLARRMANFGFSMVLVQLKEIKQEHLDTVFMLNTFLIGIVATSLYFAAPFLADFFSNEKLEAIIMVLALDFFLRSFASVPGATMRRAMRFKEINIIDTASRTCMIVGTVTLAIMGYGVWALVYGTMIGTVVGGTSTFIVSRWRPTFRFRMWALKDCFAFGMWVYVTVFINYGINKIDYFIIGRFLGATQLGFYERAFDLMSLPRKRLVKKVNSVVFATYSRIQDDDKRLVKGLLKVTRYLAVVAFPIMGWLFLAAPSFIPVVYGEKWLPAVLPLQIMCLSGLFDSFTLLFEPMLQARGWVGNQARRKGLYLLVLAGSVYAGIEWGIVGVSIGVAAASIVHLGLMMNITLKRLPITILQFLGAMRAPLVYSLIMLGVVSMAKWLAEPHFGVHSLETLLIVSVLAPLTYLGSHYIIRFQDVEDIISELMGGLKKVLRKVPVVKNMAFVQKKKKA
ncbi:MAG: lipopolysaccharide biosynthesis protein [Calditrichia bacterium]